MSPERPRMPLKLDRPEGRRVGRIENLEQAP